MDISQEDKILESKSQLIESRDEYRKEVDRLNDKLFSIGMWMLIIGILLIIDPSCDYDDCYRHAINNEQLIVGVILTIIGVIILKKHT